MSKNGMKKGIKKEGETGNKFFIRNNVLYHKKIVG